MDPLHHDVDAREAGTYIAKAKAVSKNGVERGKDASIIIQVSE